MKLRSHCPTNFALEHFGDKWSLLIIRDMMFKGKRNYNDFFDSEEKVSTSVLGDKLKNLENHGIISKGKDPTKKSRIRYSLTEKGVDLLPMMIEMIVWSGKYDEETAASEEFLQKVESGRGPFLKKICKKLRDEHLSESMKTP